MISRHGISCCKRSCTPIWSAKFSRCPMIMKTAPLSVASKNCSHCTLTIERKSWSTYETMWFLRKTVSVVALSPRIGSWPLSGSRRAAPTWSISCDDTSLRSSMSSCRIQCIWLGSKSENQLILSSKSLLCKRNQLKNRQRRSHLWRSKRSIVLNLRASRKRSSRNWACSSSLASFSSRMTSKFASSYTR